MPLSPSMIGFGETRSRNDQGQFIGEQTGGVDPNSMAAAYGGVAQRKQSQVQRLLTALKLRQPIVPMNNPMLSSVPRGTIQFALKSQILRKKKGLMQRRLYGLAPSGTSNADYAPSMGGNFSSLARVIELSEKLEFGIVGTAISEIPAFLGKNPLLKRGLIGAGVGALAGAGKAMVHNASNPNDHESIVGNALGGAALGGAAGAGSGLIGGAAKAAPTVGAAASPAAPAGAWDARAAAKGMNSGAPASVAGAPAQSFTDLAKGYFAKNFPQTSDAVAQKQPWFSSLSPSMIELGIGGVIGALDDVPAMLRLRKKKSPGGFNTEEIPSGVPTGTMLPQTSGDSQPLIDKVGAVTTNRINGVAESAQGDVDPIDPWGNGRAVNAAWWKGAKRPGPSANVSMKELRPSMIRF